MEIEKKERRGGRKIMKNEVIYKDRKKKKMKEKIKRKKERKKYRMKEE